MLHQTIMMALICWFFLVALTAKSIPNRLDAQTLLSANVLTAFSTTISLLGFFAVFVFPHVPPRIGGGETSAISINISGDAPLTKALPTRVWLIDEADTGFYLVKSESDRNAIFVPRQYVAAIQFCTRYGSGVRP